MPQKDRRAALLAALKQRKGGRLGERINGVEAQRREAGRSALPGPGRPHVGSVGDLSDFQSPGQRRLGTGPVRAAGGDVRQGGKQIGFYNATHKHGKPQEALLAKLRELKEKDKPKKRKGPTYVSTSASPSGGITGSR